MTVIPNGSVFSNLKLWTHFDNYCWTLYPSDPLYWQKIYTHLDLPYDETSPVGEPEVALDNRGDLAWQVESVKEKRKMPVHQVLLWIVGAVALIWLLVKFTK